MIKLRTVLLSTLGAVLTAGAIAVAAAPALSESQSVCCISPSWSVGLNHFVVQSVIGQPCTFEALNA